MPDPTQPSYTPLHSPERDAGPDIPPVSLDCAIRQARKVLAETQSANVHDRDQTIRAAVGLDYTLRALLASLDAEGIQ